MSLLAKPMSVAEQARAEVQEALPFELDPKSLVVLAQNEVEYYRYLPPAGPVAGPRVAQANTSFQATRQTPPSRRLRRAA